MAVDPEYLRRHYASLSDEALLDINPDELVEAARACLDAELRKRELDAPVDLEASGEDAEYDDEPSGGDGPPEWLDEGAEVFSAVVREGVMATPQAHHARRALEAAGIPCFLDIHEEEVEEEEPAPRGPVRRWRVLVPGKLNLEATGVLQREIFNDDFEAGWRTHLEVLSDEEVAALDPRDVFCGLFDQIERVNRVYREELERRRLA
jgi:hypothetical protein